MVDGRHGGAHAPGDYRDYFNRFGGHCVRSEDGSLGGELFAETSVEFSGEGFGGAVGGCSGAFRGGRSMLTVWSLSFFLFSLLLIIVTGELTGS